MKEIIITAFITAFIVASFSAYITIRIQRYFENKKKKESTLFDIYMKLMEFHGYYFWLLSAEIRKEKEPKNIKQIVERLKWEIADLARQIEVKELQEILEVLLLEKLTHRERYHRLSNLIDGLGYKLNPKYIKIMKKISEENLKLNKEKVERLLKY